MTAEAYLSAQIEKLTTIRSQETFDEWHRSTCVRLKHVYSDQNFSSFYIGQAQKWVNMMLKYLFMFPEMSERLRDVYIYCHVPLDNIILRRLNSMGLRRIDLRKDVWSRIDDYEKYMIYQCDIREFFLGSAPLAAEFDLWQS